MASLGEKVLKLREEQGLKRNDLIRKMLKTTDYKTIKKANNSLFRIEESIVKNPGVYTVKMIADTLGVSIVDLLEDTSLEENEKAKNEKREKN